MTRSSFVVKNTSFVSKPNSNLKSTIGDGWRMGLPPFKPGLVLFELIQPSNYSKTSASLIRVAFYPCYFHQASWRLSARRSELSEFNLINHNLDFVFSLPGSMGLWNKKYAEHSRQPFKHQFNWPHKTLAKHHFRSPRQWLLRLPSSRKIYQAYRNVITSKLFVLPTFCS